MPSVSVRLLKTAVDGVVLRVQVGDEVHTADSRRVDAKTAESLVAITVAEQLAAAAEAGIEIENIAESGLIEFPCPVCHRALVYPFDIPQAAA